MFGAFPFAEPAVADAPESAPVAPPIPAIPLVGGPGFGCFAFGHPAFADARLPDSEVVEPPEPPAGEQPTGGTHFRPFTSAPAYRFGGDVFLSTIRGNGNVYPIRFTFGANVAAAWTAAGRGFVYPATVSAGATVLARGSSGRGRLPGASAKGVQNLSDAEMTAFLDSIL